MFPRFIALLVSFALVGTHAEVALAADLDMARAKKHFQQGQTHYANGEYQQALERFEVAYSYKPLAGFLFNIGQCHMELENYSMALKRYNQYLRESPKARNRSRVEALIREAAAKQESVRPKTNEVVTAAKKESQPKPKPAATPATPGVSLEKKVPATNAPAPKTQPITKIIQASPVDGLPLAPLVVPNQDPLQNATIPTTGMVQSGDGSDSIYKSWWFWSIATSVVAASISAVVLTQSSPNEQIVAPSGTLGTIDRR